PGVVKILQEVTPGNGARAASVDDVIGHQGFEVAAQCSNEVQWWGHQGLFAGLGGALLVELREEIVQGHKKGFKVTEKAGRVVRRITQQLAYTALPQHGGIVVAPTGIKVMRFVNDQHTVVIRPVLKEAPQVRPRIEDVVVIANDDVRLYGHIQREHNRDDPELRAQLGQGSRAD